MTKNNPTSKEHFIPQVYLNGFASDDKRIYFYDLMKNHFLKYLKSLRFFQIAIKVQYYGGKENDKRQNYTDNRRTRSN